MVSGLQYQEVEKRSYMIWERQGRPHGHDLDHWLQAEKELAEEKMMPVKASAAKSPKKAPAAPKRKAPAKKPTLAS